MLAGPDPLNPTSVHSTLRVPPMSAVSTKFIWTSIWGAFKKGLVVPTMASTLKAPTFPVQERLPGVALDEVVEQVAGTQLPLKTAAPVLSIVTTLPDRSDNRRSGGVAA